MSIYIAHRRRKTSNLVVFSSDYYTNINLNTPTCINFVNEEMTSYQL